mmetsp:Transcript_69237/g.184555  ORF Transcript_69237/g.184555 Transcript_69237/m.184555 type:complete len:286 (+) Transcript_69237:947-1804(+)
MRWGNLNDAEGFEAYKQSKLANLLHMQELSRRYGHPSPAKMLAMCVDPGEVNTDIVRHFPLASLIKPILLLIPERNTPEQGADSVVHCLVCGEEEAAALTGRLVRERKAVDVLGETGTVFSRMVLSVVMRTSCDKESHTPEAGKVLWDLSHALVTGKTKLPRERRSAAASFWRSPAVIIIFIFMVRRNTLSQLLHLLRTHTRMSWASPCLNGRPRVRVVGIPENGGGRCLTSQAIIAQHNSNAPARVSSSCPSSPPCSARRATPGRCSFADKDSASGCRPGCRCK